MVTIRTVDQVFRSALPREALDSPEVFLKTLIPGKIVEVTVARGGETKAVLEHGGTRFVADTQTPLREGERLNLLVTANSPRIELKIAERPAVSLSQQWPLLTEKTFLPRLLTQILGSPEEAGPRLGPELLKLLEGFAGRVPEPGATAGEKGLASWLRGLDGVLGRGVSGTVSDPGHGMAREGVTALLADLLRGDEGLRRGLEDLLKGLQRGTLSGREVEVEALLTAALGRTAGETLAAGQGGFSEWLKGLDAVLGRGVSGAVSEPGKGMAREGVTALLADLLRGDEGLRRGLEDLLKGLQRGTLSGREVEVEALLTAALGRSAAAAVNPEGEALAGWLKGFILSFVPGREEGMETGDKAAREGVKALLADLLRGDEGLRRGLENLLNGLQRGSLSGQGVEAESFLMALLAASDGKDAAGEKELVVRWLKNLGFPLASEPGAEASEPAAADLRGALKTLLSDLPEAHSELRRGLETVLDGMIGQRLPTGGKGEEAFLFYLPLPFLEKGFLLWERDRGEKEDHKPGAHRMTLFLETQALGELRIDFLFEGEGVMLRFSSPSKEVRNFLASCRQELVDGWPDFPLLGLRFDVAKETPGSELAQRLTGKSEGGMVTAWA